MILVATEVEAALAVHHRNHPDVFGDDQRRRASTTWTSMLDAIVLHTIDRSLADSAVRLNRITDLCAGQALHDLDAVRLADSGVLESAQHEFDLGMRPAVPPRDRAGG